MNPQRPFWDILRILHLDIPPPLSLFLFNSQYYVPLMLHPPYIILLHSLAVRLMVGTTGRGRVIRIGVSCTSDCRLDRTVQRYWPLWIYAILCNGASFHF